MYFFSGVMEMWEASSTICWAVDSRKLLKDSIY